MPLAEKAAQGKKVDMKEKKEFDTRNDKILEIESNEDYLMDSLKNFNPPAEQTMLDMSGVYKSQVGTARVVIAGVKMRNMIDNDEQDIEEINQVNFLLD